MTGERLGFESESYGVCSLAIVSGTSWGGRSPILQGHESWGRGLSWQIRGVPWLRSNCSLSSAVDTDLLHGGVGV